MELRLDKITGTARALRSRAMHLGGRGQFVLIIGDEGAVMAHFRHGAVADAWFVSADEMDEGLESLRGYLNADKSAPLLVLADVLEQMYRDESLPKVGILDEIKVLRRRLEMTFPNEQLKAALRLHGKDAKGGVPFLMAALPTSPHLLRWITFLESLKNPVTGFCLLPLESVGLAQALTPALEVKAEDQSRCWHALITIEVTGGFRQIFVNNGRLVVTRLTQRPLDDSTPDMVAQLLERELRSSISYIKRLGYVEGHRLDIVMVAGSELCEALAQREIPATTVSLLTPGEAGKIIHLDKVGPEGSPYGDLLHAAWAIRKKNPVLVIPTAVIGLRRLFAKLTYYGGLSALVLTAIAAWVAFDYGQTYYEQYMDLDGLEAQTDSANRQLVIEQRKLAAFSYPVAEMKAVANIGRIWQRRQLELPDLLMPLTALLTGDVRVIKLVFTDLVPKPDALGAEESPQSMPAAEQLTFEMVVTVELGAGSTLEQSVARAKDFFLLLKAAYPQYKVDITSFPANILEGQVLEGTLDKNDPDASTLNKNVAVFTIRKET